MALRHSPDASELEAWAELRRIARFDIQRTLRSGLLGRVPTGATRCGYDHEVAGSTAMRAWSLDHLLYSPATLAPVARWATLEASTGALERQGEQQGDLARPRSLGSHLLLIWHLARAAGLQVLTWCFVHLRVTL